MNREEQEIRKDNRRKQEKAKERSIKKTINGKKRMKRKNKKIKIR